MPARLAARRLGVVVLRSALALGFAVLGGTTVRAADPDTSADGSVKVTETFDEGAARWRPTEPEGWKTETLDGRTVYSQFVKKNTYKPQHRSPYHIALLKDVSVGSFTLDATVKSTHTDYGHRDACLVFGYQGPDAYYYVHLGRSTDDHANQIFIVNHADRTKISTKTSEGTPWTDGWHHVRIVREAKAGVIEVYFDDMTTPAMTAMDRTFTSGQIGIGSFDDTTAWDEVKLTGTAATPKAPSK